jgi:4-amino-4-deoxy-L-arabinose transferase-like glycosyltransferase
MPLKRKMDFFIWLILAVALLLPRLPALDSFSTLDEPYWLSMGANFYYALGQREFQNTVYEYQPAVTTMWIVTAAMLAYFPEYRGLGQGYLEFEKGALDPFLLAHGKNPLALLHAARLIQVVIIVLLFLLLYFLLQRLVSKPAAFFAVLFASLDPFFLGQSRLLDHEALLALFVMVSVLAFWIYLARGRGVFLLVLSGVSAGLAQLTKSSAIAILLPLGVLLLIGMFRSRREGLFTVFLDHAKVFMAWLIVLVVTYFVFWPGMWVAPAKMLYQVYGNAFSYAFQGARLAVTEQLQPARFSLSLGLAGIWDLIRVLLWRTTPLTWLGILFGCALPFTRDRERVRPNRQIFALLISTAAAFLLLFGIAQGRNSPHYILSTYLALNLLAGLGWFFAVEWIAGRIERLQGRRTQYAVLLLLAGLQFWSAALFYPYYYTYRNPVLYAAGGHPEFPQFSYGEGLELAAQYLASLPNAPDSTAVVFYSRGCFSYFYPGTTTRFKPYYVDAGHEQDLVDSIRSADYLVLYYASQGALEKYRPLLKTLSVARPIHEVWLDDYKYVVIYQVDALPSEVYEAFLK